MATLIDADAKKFITQRVCSSFEEIASDLMETEPVPEDCFEPVLWNMQDRSNLKTLRENAAYSSNCALLHDLLVDGHRHPDFDLFREIVIETIRKSYFG